MALDYFMEIEQEIFADAVCRDFVEPRLLINPAYGDLELGGEFAGFQQFFVFDRP